MKIRQQLVSEEKWQRTKSKTKKTKKTGACWGHVCYVSNVSSREHQQLLTCGCKWFENEVMMMSASDPKVSGTQKHGDVCGIIPEAAELDARTKTGVVTNRFILYYLCYANRLTHHHFHPK